MSDMGATIVRIDEDEAVTVWADTERSLVFMQVYADSDDIVIALPADMVDEIILALAAARVEIQPPTIPAKPLRKPRQLNVPDNADALARVAMSTPERIDGDEK